MSFNDSAVLMAKYGLDNYSNASVSKRGDTIYVNKNGQVYTLQVTPGANRNTVLQWGNNLGVDLSNYV